MKKHLVTTILLILSPLFFVSCVSTLLQEKAPTFSKDIKYKDPESNFRRVNKSIYPAWKNRDTGNVISLISDCSENNYVSLSQLQLLITDSIEQSKMIKQEQITFQQKPALLNFTEGSLDSQPIEVRSISFKRKNCGYVSSLSGRPKSLERDQKAFNEFNESFTFE